MSLTLDNKKIMDTFTQDNLPDLSVCTLGALELFASKGLPKVKIPDFQKPIIVGSGNAIVTANLLYGDKDAIFANESNYQQALERDHDGAIIFSASGEKHATVVAEYYRDKNVKTTLVTCNPSSSAGKILGSDNTVVTPKNREPYTYNTSTYMGWIFAKTRENPGEIHDFILDTVKPALPANLPEFNGYLIITPENFSRGNRLFEVKFVELFGRKIAKDVRTFEEARHAVTVVPSESETLLQFGKGQVDFPGHKINIPLPDDPGLASIMAVGYYVIGQIQAANPPWFFDNIAAYIQRATSSSFGKGLSVVVE